MSSCYSQGCSPPSRHLGVSLTKQKPSLAVHKREGKPWAWIGGRRGEGGFTWGSHGRESWPLCVLVTPSTLPPAHSVVSAWPLQLASVLSWATGLGLAQLREITRGSETHKSNLTALAQSPGCLTSSPVVFPTRTGMTHPVSSATKSGLNKTITRTSAIAFSHVIIL